MSNGLKKALKIIGIVVSIIIVLIVAFFVVMYFIGSVLIKKEAGLAYNNEAIAQIMADKFLSPSQKSTGYSTFVQSKGEYSYLYPKDWKIVTPGKSIDSHIRYEKSDTEYGAIQSFVITSTLERALLAEKQIMEDAYSDIKFGATQKTSIDGNPSYKMEYSFSTYSENNKGMLILVSKGPKVYAFTFGGSEAVYKKYSNVIISSFKVK